MANSRSEYQISLNRCLLSPMQGLAVVLFPVLLMMFALGMEHLEQFLKQPTARQLPSKGSADDLEDHSSKPTLNLSDRRAS